MPQPERIEIEEVVIEQIRLKLTERDCPRCDAVLVHNDYELCYECLNCGYIDCGDGEED
ncbi:hypothetical protein [Segetibacter koreensis]|uniref:hypothetical protein n=1 Tax=Segetibacter koreensis TaxID=398037 RepID=UPI00037A1E04|nr:hypothetical protein [Segetibacter koreensis]